MKTPTRSSIVITVIENIGRHHHRPHSTVPLPYPFHDPQVFHDFLGYHVIALHQSEATAPSRPTRYCKNKLIKHHLFYFVWFSLQGPTPLPQIGLWTFEPAFSPRFFSHLEPTILFSHLSAVSHLKPRDFRFS